MYSLYQVLLLDSEKEEEESLEVVHKALSAIIGDEPSEEQKLTPEVKLLPMFFFRRLVKCVLIELRHF